MSEFPEILYEDNHLIAVSKPSGILSQGDSTGRENLLDILKNYIKITCNKPGNVFLGLVHRLDFPVTGAIVFARTSKAAKRMHALFLKKDVHKFYLAIVPSASMRDDWQILKGHAQREGDRTRILEAPSSNTRESLLRYKKISGNSQYSLLLIRLLTGRKHQIRAQLSHEGFPVAGDLKYGSKIPYPEGIALHSYFLRFKHPTRDETVEITAPFPSDFQKLLPETVNIDKKIIDSISEEIKR